MAEKNLKLKSVPENNTILAISCSLRNFQFCDLLNKMFAMKLSIQTTVKIQLSTREVEPLSYSYDDDLQKQKFTLIDNQTNGGPFLDFLKTVRYFIKISPSPNKEKIEQYVADLRTLPDVTFVQVLDIQNIPSKHKKDTELLFKNL